MCTSSAEAHHDEIEPFCRKYVLRQIPDGKTNKINDIRGFGAVIRSFEISREDSLKATAMVYSAILILFTYLLPSFIVFSPLFSCLLS